MIPALLPTRLARLVRCTGRPVSFGALALVALFASPAQADVAKEYQLKAAFLYNFTRFVEWPEDKFAGKQSPIVIGLWKTNPFGRELEATIGARTVNGRPIVVRTCSSLAEACATHIVFVSANDTERLQDTVAALQERRVLTVGESRPFAAADGTITFLLEGDKLRFEINLRSGDRAGLKLSSQLLKLATSVRR